MSAANTPFSSFFVSPTPLRAPSPPKQHSLTSRCVAEFLGTFLLVFTVGCNVLAGDKVWAGVSIAAVLMVAIYSLGGISGANFNPAVTFALLLAKQAGCAGSTMTIDTACCYWASQLAGGLVAGISYTLLLKDSIQLTPGKHFGWMEAGACEALYTFVLCFVVLNVAARRDAPNQYFGLAIGFVIIAGAYGAGAVSGGCFNPAVALGIDSSSAGFGMRWCFAYALFELFGAGLAAALFRAVRPEEAGGRQEAAQRLLSEFLGAFVLVLTVGLNVLAASPAAAFSIAASLTCMIYALGDVSGAHFNPAVTLCVFASGLDSGLQAGMAAAYLAAQVAGGLLAQLIFFRIYPGQSITLGPKVGFGWSDVALAETVFTFVLCLAVLCSAVHNTSKNEDYFGLIIGSCVTVGGLAAGGISGGSLNPAVSFSLDAQHFGQSAFTKAALYSTFELLGAGAAVGCVLLTHGRSTSKDYGLPA